MRPRSGTREANLGHFGFWRTRLSGRLHSYIVSKLNNMLLETLQSAGLECFSTV